VDYFRIYNVFLILSVVTGHQSNGELPTTKDHHFEGSLCQKR